MNLATLETRHLRGDLIKAFKVLKGFELLMILTIKKFTLCNTELHVHSLKLYKSRFSSILLKIVFFSQKINIK